MGRLLDGPDQGLRADGHDQVGTEPDELVREFGHPLGAPLGRPELDGEVSAFDIAELAEPLFEGRVLRGGTRAGGGENADPVNFLLLSGGAGRCRDEAEGHSG